MIKTRLSTLKDIDSIAPLFKSLYESLGYIIDRAYDSYSFELTTTNKCN